MIDSSIPPRYLQVKSIPDKGTGPSLFYVSPDQPDLQWRKNWRWKWRRRWRWDLDTGIRRHGPLSRCPSAGRQGTPFARSRDTDTAPYRALLSTETRPGPILSLRRCINSTIITYFWSLCKSKFSTLINRILEFSKLKENIHLADLTE
jgi:hypothetical protein